MLHRLVVGNCFFYFFSCAEPSFKQDKSSNVNTFGGNQWLGLIYQPSIFIFSFIYICMVT